MPVIDPFEAMEKKLSNAIMLKGHGASKIEELR